MTAQSSLVVAALLLSPSLWSCPAEELNTRDPVTLSLQCTPRATPGYLTIFTSTECAPCANQLATLEKLRAEPRHASARILLVWLDSDPKSCATSAMKHRHLGESRCGSAREANRLWNVVETPTAYWMAGNQLQRLVGGGTASLWSKHLTEIQNQN